MQTLVLDAGFQPVERIPWERAITLVIKRFADVVDEHPDRYINTVNWSVKMPSVIRLIKPVKRKKAVKFSRYNVYARDGGKCQYCRARVTLQDMTYDHVTPRSKGGQTTWENVVTACVPCNQRKGQRTLEQAGMTLLSTPVRPKKLPELHRQMDFKPGMPEGWRSWLRSETYWNGTLENDDTDGE